MSYFRADDGDDLEQSNDFDDDGRTPLDKTIDRIGMGACLVISTDYPGNRDGCAVVDAFGRIQAAINGLFFRSAGLVSSLRVAPPKQI